MPAVTTIQEIEEALYTGTDHIPNQNISDRLWRFASINAELSETGLSDCWAAELTFDMPLGEIVFDFYDKLKSISRGYASFDYHKIGFKPAKLVRSWYIAQRWNGWRPFVAHLHFENGIHWAQDVRKLRELIPRQQFDIAIQAAIGAKIIALKRLSGPQRCHSQIVTGWHYPEAKTVEKQKKGKRELNRLQCWSAPKAFLAVLKLD
jgi:GTP-binding protein LepA